MEERQVAALESLANSFRQIAERYCAEPTFDEVLDLQKRRRIELEREVTADNELRILPAES